MDLLWVTRADMDAFGTENFSPHSPRGKERVYFACHPADFERYFYDVATDIFRTQNCAIYYNPDPDAKWSEEELDLDFSQMQLLVIPIPSNFLFSKSRARDVEFQYAMDHHIPILPLMQEGELEMSFNEICGDLQFLSKVKKDPTALPFSQKLSKFLQSVLLGDALVQKVRDAFCAYIFLSYRKKDRKYAQELMRLIHKNDFARDIAIWYDEYLAPGENFNDAIFNAMAKSEIFALVVTPNLLNEENYVKNVEYPEAVKTGMKILPVKMRKTWSFWLKRKFKKIPKPIKGSDETALSTALVEALTNIALSENTSDPKHLFFIGLAYLGGIDVEMDQEKALTLIQTAAEAGLLEAMSKLVSMYQKGEAVKRDYQQAIIWQKRLVAALREVYESAPTRENAQNLFYSLWDLSSFWENMGNFDEAKEVCVAMCTFAREAKAQFDFTRYVSVSFGKLGDVMENLGDLQAAKAYYEKMLAIDEALAGEKGTAEAQRDLAVACGKLGGILENLEDLQAAKQCYEKTLAIFEALADEQETARSQSDLAISYGKLGDVARAYGDLRSARVYAEKAVAILEALAGETGSAEFRRNLSIAYSGLGEVAYEAGDLEMAKEYYKKALSIGEKLAEETGTLEFRRKLAIDYRRLGDVALDAEDFKTAKLYFTMAFSVAKKIVDETGTVQSRKDLSIYYERLGDVAKEAGDFKTAKDYYMQELAIDEVLDAEVSTISSRRGVSISYTHLGDVARDTKDFEAAKVYYEKALAIDRTIVKETETVEARRNLSATYSKLGDAFCGLLELETAREYYETSLAMDEALVAECDLAEACGDLVTV